MSLVGPIIIIEDDIDDQEIIAEVLKDLEVVNPLHFFSACSDALVYLKTTTERPFLILSDVNLPDMNGSELKMKINEDEELKKKSIPFVFFTTTATRKAIDHAYEMVVQGYFEKPASILEMTKYLKIIIDYWRICKHPNNF